MRLPSLWRRDPFPLLRGWFGNDFDKLFDEFFGRMRFPVSRAATEGEIAFVPDVDVIEHDNEYVIKAELPGLDLEDIEVTTVGNNTLQIKGEKKVEKEEKKENYYFCERSYGSFLRTIPLPIAVDADKVTAKLEKGILEVVAPKAETVKPKKIEVKGEATAKSAESPRPREERAREKK